MKSWSLVGLAVVGFAVSSLGVGCKKNENRGDSKVIKIVSSLPRTGANNKQTTDMVNGFKLAFEEAGWKVGQFEIRYEDWDDASPQTGNWDSAIEASNANRAVKDPDVMIYLGTYNSGAAKVAMPILNEADLLMISPANTWPGLTKPGKGEPNEPGCYIKRGKKRNYCRVVPADDIQGPVAAEWAKQLGVKKVFVLHDRELYGQGIADLFKKQAEKLGIEIAGYEGIDTQASNYQALANKIIGTGPDLVYFGGTTASNGGQLCKDLRNAGYKGPLMVPDGCFEKAFINAAGAQNVEGNTYATFGGVPVDQWTGKAREFLEKFTKKFGNPKPEPYSVYGYEAAKVALEAIKRAGKKDRAAIRDACFAIRDFEGTLGKWSFDENGDTTITLMSGNIVKDGEWTFLTELRLGK